MEIVVLILGIIIALMSGLTLVALIVLSKRKNVENPSGMDEKFIIGENEKLKNDFTNIIRAQSTTTFDAVKFMSDTNETRILELSKRVEDSLKNIKDETSHQLTDMRAVVDEKLSKTLNDRLSSSFSVISERLEAVATKLGEVQNLTAGVTDLKRLMSNVKLRGGIGEIMLGDLLEDILHESQFERQFKVTGSEESRVDFAVKLPGKIDGEVLYLPIDSKFPSESYLKLQDATEAGDKDKVDEARKELLRAVDFQARSIRDKYIKVPKTTDFAIMYLPTEGLYAEIVRDSNFIKKLRDYKITPAGPTTLASILNALKIGFETLAIQKSTADVMKIFALIKKDLSTFNDNLADITSNLDKVYKSIEKASDRGRILSKKLDKVALPEAESIDE